MITLAVAVVTRSYAGQFRPIRPALIMARIFVFRRHEHVTIYGHDIPAKSINGSSTLRQGSLTSRKKKQKNMGRPRGEEA